MCRILGGAECPTTLEKEIESTENIDNTGIKFLHFRWEIQNLSGESPDLPAKNLSLLAR